MIRVWILCEAIIPSSWLEKGACRAGVTSFRILFILDFIRECSLHLTFHLTAFAHDFSAPVWSEVKVRP